jgi:mRNA-degrading endonuclease RelE of RelBE toxin-antitoxin system
MKLEYYPKFKLNLRKFPKEIRKKFYKQAAYLLHDIRHPSLDVKKYDEERGIWQARVDRKIRFYFLIEGDSYILLNIKSHPK